MRNGYEPQLESIRLSADKHILNPVLNPSDRLTVKLEGYLEDGSPVGPEEMEIRFSGRTLHTSGAAEVIRVEADGTVRPLAGGVGLVEAAASRGNVTRTAEMRVIVRPFYREYHQTLTMKLYLGMDGQVENEMDFTVLQTFETALETIRKIDCLTRGMPKIIYLVGWQEGGHDHLYPSWSDVNHRLKRAEDETALDSLKWLIREAEQYNTSVSLHINMNDAYEDSPLFEAYRKADLLARKADGSLLCFDFYPDRPMYAVSPTREWESGLAKKRVDELCDMLPELWNTHSIHIDNWVVKSHHDGGPLSPYHNISIEQDEEVQRELFRYWRSKGFDVTSEGSWHGRTEPKIGLQPMTWWGLSFDPMEIPACLYCGGREDRLGGDPRFGDSMHGEDLMMRNHGKADILEGFEDEFCLNTLPWHYLNRLERLKVENGTVYYSEGVTAGCKDGRVLIQKGETVLRFGDIVFIPVLWKTEKEIIAYGHRNSHITNKLPEDWAGVGRVDIREITQEGIRILAKGVKVGEDGKLELSLQGGRAVSIVPSGEEKTY